MLYVLIPLALGVLGLLGLTMFRLASISDDSEAIACAEWMASSQPPPRSSTVDNGALENPSAGRAYGAAR